MRASLSSLLRQLRADTLAREKAGTLSHAARIVRAFLEADISTMTLGAKGAALSEEAKRKGALLFSAESGTIWEAFSPHAVSELGSFRNNSAGNSNAVAVALGLHIGQAHALCRADGTEISAADLQTAFYSETLNSEVLRIAASLAWGGSFGNSYLIAGKTSFLYEAQIPSGSKTTKIPMHAFWKTTALQHANFSRFESLFVTVGEGPSTIAVSSECGRLFYPGTRALLEALSPFATKRALPAWTGLGSPVYLERAAMLIGLLEDPFFAPTFLWYERDLKDSLRQDRLIQLAMRVDMEIGRGGKSRTSVNRTRAILPVCAGTPWFDALVDGIRDPSEQGNTLREAFAPIWDLATKSGRLRSFSNAKTLFSILGAPKQTSTKASKASSLGMRRLGLWRAQRQDARATTLSETKIFLARQRLEAFASNTLVERGLPADLRPTVAFTQKEDAPEAQWDERTNTLFLQTHLLERPWRHLQDTLVWSLAHGLEAHYLRAKVSSPHAAAAGESPWALACRRLSLRAEFWRHKGLLHEVPEEAWLGRENLDDEERRFLEKVDKLLNLSTSANEHEAALAMSRAQLLLGVRRIELRKRESDPNAAGARFAGRPFVSLTLSLGVKKIETVTSAIASLLLRHYAVSAIWGQEYDPMESELFVTLTIVGRKENVLLAEHVFDFLSHQAQSLWQRARKEQHLEARMRVSFQYGLIQGFEEKLEKARKGNTESASGLGAEFALVRLDDAELDAHMRELFPEKTSRAGSGIKLHAKGVEAGKEEGTRLSIHAPITASDSAKKSPLSLGH